MRCSAEQVALLAIAHEEPVAPLLPNMPVPVVDVQFAQSLAFQVSPSVYAFVQTICEGIVRAAPVSV